MAALRASRLEAPSALPVRSASAAGQSGGLRARRHEQDPRVRSCPWRRTRRDRRKPCCRPASATPGRRRPSHCIGRNGRCRRDCRSAGSHSRSSRIRRHRRRTATGGQCRCCRFRHHPPHRFCRCGRSASDAPELTRSKTIVKPWPVTAQRQGMKRLSGLPVACRSAATAFVKVSLRVAAGIAAASAFRPVSRARSLLISSLSLPGSVRLPRLLALRVRLGRSCPDGEGQSEDDIVS